MLKIIHRCFSEALLAKDFSQLTLKSPFNPITFQKKKHVLTLSDHEEKRIDSLLSQEQKELVNAMHAGHNIYFTGTISI
jgi:hypothetical protein